MHAHALDRLDSSQERDDTHDQAMTASAPDTAHAFDVRVHDTLQWKAAAAPAKVTQGARALQPNLGNSHLDGRRVQPSLQHRHHHTVPQPQPVSSAIQTFHLERAEFIKSTFDNFPPFEMKSLWQVLRLTDFIPAM